MLTSYVMESIGTDDILHAVDEDASGAIADPLVQRSRNTAAERSRDSCITESLTASTSDCLSDATEVVATMNINAYLGRV